ncbi:hypothetical protein CVT24_007474 [Panaeolus cyanescens]|uniref:F-box domain-containing protein n=1 Tax=Panaeolus cyanescens TaxID=181874 RepID=A0A409YMI3_9AGAR|nr:hypothetical protein CVT24_007474 [Panaeolus cyanescens]
MPYENPETVDCNGNERDKLEGLIDLPPEVLLHILSFLDIPDLDALSRVLPALIPLTADPILHKQRITVISPSRVNHNLFGVSREGHPFRPTVADLCRRGVIKGLNIERRWRMGAYFYSLSSIIQYENSKALSRRHTSRLLTVQLRRRTVAGSPSNSLQTLHSSHVLPDIESSSPNIARSLLPVMRKLKWSLQRDKLAKAFKTSVVKLGMGAWLEDHENSEKGRRVLVEGEKLRFAVCPDIRKRVGFYERLARGSR